MANLPFSAKNNNIIINNNNSNNIIIINNNNNANYNKNNYTNINVNNSKCNKNNNNVLLFLNATVKYQKISFLVLVPPSDSLVPIPPLTCVIYLKNKCTYLVVLLYFGTQMYSVKSFDFLVFFPSFDSLVLESPLTCEIFFKLVNGNNEVN